MTNNEFKDALDKLLKPIGFKKKGNTWKMDTIDLEKIIELQKSGFSNLYYLNYGYKFKDLDYDEVSIHIYNRLASEEPIVNKAIRDTFDLEKSMDKTTRIQNLRYFVNNLLLIEVNSANNKADVVDQLKTRRTLNDIPLRVKEYLNLHIE